jgi:uncharacterized protein DUF268
LKRFLRDHSALFRRNKESSDPWKISPNYPCLTDFYDQSGNARGHYFHQDLLVAQKIFAAKPLKHVDFGSRIDGLVAHIASFRTVEVFDYRPLFTAVPSVQFRQANLLDVSPNLQNYCDSLSCLHVIEHIGLGRYGDPLDLTGYMTAIHNLAKILVTGGKLYLSFPIGTERIEFNAHRIFSLKRMIPLLEASFRIVEFRCVDDFGDLLPPESAQSVSERSDSFDYSLGIFELNKI